MSTTDSAGSDDTRALVAAIDRLTREVAGVRAALDRIAETGAATPTAASPAPDWVQQARRAAAATTAVAQLADAPDSAEAATSRQVDDIEKLLSVVFMAALDPDDEAGFENFVSAMHTSRIDAPRSIPSLREFNWKSLRRNVSRYLTDDGDATSFQIVSRSPDTLDGKTDTVKVFLACPGRSPVPVTLRRDKAQDSAWRITDSSL